MEDPSAGWGLLGSARVRGGGSPEGRPQLRTRALRALRAPVPLSRAGGRGRSGTQAAAASSRLMVVR
jgi:hypothetical protein